MATPSNFPDGAVDCAAADALEVLSQLDDGPSLVQAWVQAANAAAVQQTALYGAGPNRKAARRGLNVLKSRGIEIPPALRQGKTGTGQQPAEAYLMSPDPSGVSVIAIVEPQKRGLHKTCFVYLGGDQRIVMVENGSTTPTKLKNAMNRMIPGAAYKAVAIPVGWARHRIAEVRKAHLEGGTPEPLGFETAKSLLEPLPEQTPEHPFEAEGFALSKEDAKELASDSGGLHHWPEFGGWMPSDPSVGELLREVGKHLKEGEEPEPGFVESQLKKEVLAATDRYFTPEAREQLVRRMKDAGISVLARSGETAALKLAATMQVVSECGLITDAPQEVPFLVAFFEKAVSLRMAKDGGRLQIPIPRSA